MALGDPQEGPSPSASTAGSSACLLAQSSHHTGREAQCGAETCMAATNSRPQNKTANQFDDGKSFGGSRKTFLPSTSSNRLTGNACDSWQGAADDPTTGPVRWLILFLSCWIMFGNYYAFDNPSALNRPLRGWLAAHHDEDLFQYRLNLMYSVYSVPNIVLPFFVGKWLDRFGSQAILLTLSFLVALGQALVALGIHVDYFALTILGRIVFGLGGESLAVAQSRLVTEWFEGKELALAIGLNLSIARIGTVVNNVLSPWIATNWSVPVAFWVGFFSCLLSFTCTVGTVLLDNYFRPQPSRLSQQSEHETRHGIRPLTPSKMYSRSFWVLAVICFLFYGCMVPYNNVASDYIHTRYYPGNLVQANSAMSIPDTMALILIPIVGMFVDRRGGRVGLIMVGSLALMLGHMALGLGSLGGAIAPLCILGFGYSMLLTFWACVPSVVWPLRHATAYGILTSSCNLAVSVISIIVAPIVTDDPTYRNCGLFFAALGGLAALLSGLLGYLNLTDHLGLNRPAIRQRALSTVIPAMVHAPLLPSFVEGSPIESASNSSEHSSGSCSQMGIDTAPATPLSSVMIYSEELLEQEQRRRACSKVASISQDRLSTSGCDHCIVSEPPPFC